MKIDGQGQVHIRTEVGSDRDRWFYNAVRDHDLLNEEGAFSDEDAQHAVSEGTIETALMRTWVLTPVTDGSEP